MCASGSTLRADFLILTKLSLPHHSLHLYAVLSVQRCHLHPVSRLMQYPHLHANGLIITPYVPSLQLQQPSLSPLSLLVIHLLCQWPVVQMMESFPPTSFQSSQMCLGNSQFQLKSSPVKPYFKDKWYFPAVREHV